MASTLLIFEPNIGGHHAHYLRHMIEAASSLPIRLEVCLPEAARQQPEFAIHLEHLSAEVNMRCEVRPTNKTALMDVSKHQFHELERLVSIVRPDHVWIPYADGITQADGLRRLCRRKSSLDKVVVEGLLLRGGFAYSGLPWKRRLQQHVSSALIRLSSWNTLHFLDPIPYSSVRSKLAGRATLMPEPIESSLLIAPGVARQRLGIPQTGKYLGSIGAQNLRKGSDKLLHAFVIAQRDDEDRLLLAGPIDPEIRSNLQSYNSLIETGKIVILDRHMTVQELDTAICATNVVCTPYPFHVGSSSFVLRAAAARRELLAADYGWIGWCVNTFNLGHCVDVNDTTKFSERIAVCLNDCNLPARSDRSQNLVRFHSIDNFKSHWLQRIANRLKCDAPASFPFPAELLPR